MTHAHTKAGGQAWEGRAARRPLGGSTRTTAGSSSTAQPLAARDPAAHGTPRAQRGADEPTACLCPWLTPGLASRVKRKRVFPRSALYIFLRSHVTPSVPVRGGRHVVQICRSLRESSTDARPTGDGKARAVRRGCKSARVRQWLTRIEREGSPPSCQIDSPSYFTTSGIGSHGAYASESLFSRRPHGRLGLAQEETPSVVSEEVANDSSSKPIRVFTKHTPFFCLRPGRYLAKSPRYRRGR